MTAIHRHNDLRTCGATTIVSGQGDVYANGKLISVDGDENTHSGGALIASGSTVIINGKPVIVIGDLGEIDGLLHVGGADAASTGSGDVSAY